MYMNMEIASACFLWKFKPIELIFVGESRNVSI